MRIYIYTFILLLLLVTHWRTYQFGCKQTEYKIQHDTIKIYEEQSVKAQELIELNEKLNKEKVDLMNEIANKNNDIYQSVSKDNLCIDNKFNPKIIKALNE